MAKRSAGLVIYRVREGALQVLLVHPGGPWWRGKDLGAWSIPKGEIEAGEDGLTAARREASEEVGLRFPPEGVFTPLTSVKTRSGKVIEAWGVEWVEADGGNGGDGKACLDGCNTVETEWPPRSGRMISFREVDEARWCGLEEAVRLLNPAQAPLVHELERVRAARSPG